MLLFGGFAPHLVDEQVKEELHRKCGVDLGMLEYREYWSPEQKRKSMVKTTVKTERRESRRFDLMVPMYVKLADKTLSMPSVRMHTRNISRNGFSLGTTIRLENGTLVDTGNNRFDMIVPYLVLDGKLLGFGLELPLGKGRVAGTGQVRWCRRGVDDDGFHMNAGILLKTMNAEGKKLWLEFVGMKENEPE